MRRTHENRVKQFLAASGGLGPYVVKTEHQLAHIRRRELSFDPLLMEAANWEGRLNVGGRPVVMGTEI